MNSHFQSSDTTSTSIGADEACKRARGSRSCEPIQAIPPRNRTTNAGMAQTTNSIRPEYDQSRSRRALRLPARNHHANTPVARMTGTTTASMMTVASNRMVRSAPPMGPCGSRTPEEPQALSSKASSRTQALAETRISGRTQKVLKDLHECLQLIVMYPMSGIGKGDDARLPEVTCASVFLGVRCPAVVAVTQQ